MARNRGRTRSLERQALSNESRSTIDTAGDTLGVGEQYLQDKEKLEAAMERVSMADISESDKRELLAELDAQLEQVQAEYEENVTEEMNELEEEASEIFAEMEEAKENLNVEAQALRDVTMEVSTSDTGAAADKAENESREIEALHAERIAQMEAKMAVFRDQQREMRVKKLRGR